MTETSQQYDIVGDVHGCGSELEALLAKLGYGIEGDVIRHPDQRRFISWAIWSTAARTRSPCCE